MDKERTEMHGNNRNTRNEVEQLRKKLKLYQQKCRRLQNKVNTLTALLKHVREKQRELLSEADAKLID